MEIARERIDSVVVGILGPYLGATMARAAVDGHCRSLAFVGAALEPDEVDRLIERLRQGMTVFVGADKASALAGSLRAGLIGADPGTPT